MSTLPRRRHRQRLGVLTERLSHWDGVFDKLGVDGMVNVVGQMVYTAGDCSRNIQTGKLRNYLMFLAVALVGLFAGVLRLDLRPD